MTKVTWWKMDEKRPPAYGKYAVMRTHGQRLVSDEYLWNGSYWVTRGGSPSRSVKLWAEVLPDWKRGDAVAAEGGTK